MLAKTASSLDALSNGRLVLGLSVGARKEDYDFAGIDYRGRGKRLSEQLSSLRSIWEEGSIGPAVMRPGGPAVLIGGLSDQGYARMVRYADGYVHGGGPPRAFARAADKAPAPWYHPALPRQPQLRPHGHFPLANNPVPQPRSSS